MRVIYPITVTPAVLVSSSIPDETTYPAFVVGTTYNAGDRVILDQQAVYECLAAGVVGALPLSDAEWVVVRPTDRWAMFDQLPSTSRQQSSALTITLAVPAVGDVMLLGVVAASVTVTLPDVTRTVTLATNTEQSVYITGLGSAGGNLTITIQPVVVVTSLIMRVAEILVGTVQELGETQMGAGVGISDYSTRTIDEYGNASFVRRGYSGFLQAQFILDRGAADLVLDTITALRAVPCVWIGSLHYQCAVVYGYYREATMEIAENHAECTMRIESLAVDTLTGTVSGGGGGGGGSGGGSYDGWWSNWAGWEQPVISPPPPPPPPPPPQSSVFAWPGFPTKTFTQGVGNGPLISYDESSTKLLGGSGGIDYVTTNDYQQSEWIIVVRPDGGEARPPPRVKFTGLNKIVDWCAELRIGVDNGGIYQIGLSDNGDVFHAARAYIRFSEDQSPSYAKFTSCYNNDGGYTVSESNFDAPPSIARHHIAITSGASGMNLWINGSIVCSAPQTTIWHYNSPMEVMRHRTYSVAAGTTPPYGGGDVHGPLETIDGNYINYPEAGRGLFIGGLRFSNYERYTSAFVPPTELTL